MKIKWLKNKYDVDIMLDEPAEVLQTQVVHRLSAGRRTYAARSILRVRARAGADGAWAPLQLFALTGVPPDRQKITAGAKQIKEDTDLKTIGLKDKQVDTL